MNSVAFSTDGHTIFAGDDTGCVYAWDVASGALRWRVGFEAGHGLRETFIRDKDGYIWVPDVPI